MTHQTPAGWYPDPAQVGRQRYWDGSAWTDNYAPLSQSPIPSKGGGIPTGVKALLGVVGVLVLMGACGALITGGDTDSPSAQVTQSTTEPDRGSPTATVTADEPSDSQAEEQSEGTALTVSQENALGSAESYLGTGAFSRTGLIEQLEFEGYSKKDATFAADNVPVDWNEQAAKAAESYLEFQNFSRSGLIEQLEFEGFTSKQAAYGAESVGL